MIPECFKIPFIGLKLACDESSSSGLYINDIEGMSFRFAAGAAKDTYTKGEDLFRSKERLAIKDTIRDFLLLCQKDFSFKDILSDQYITGKWGDYEAFDKYGFEVSKCEDNFIGLEIPYFSIFPENTLNVTVIVKADGTTVMSFDKQVIGGEENKILIDYKGNANVVQVYVNLCGNRARTLTSCNCQCIHSCNGCATIRPLTTINDVLDYAGHYSAKGSVICRCSFEHMICAYKGELALPILYNTAIKLSREYIFSNNINPYMDANKESVKELLLIWEGVPSEGEMFDKRSEYFKSLYNVVLMARNYIKNSRTICKECAGWNVVTHCLN